MKKFFYIILITFFFSSCEKDDICAADTPTTPNLVIEFFDKSTNLSKTVSNLEVAEFGTNTVYKTFNESKIKIPLKTFADVVKYKFTINKGATIGQNLDHLQFDYTRNNVYISRACGFKTVYVLKNSPTLTDSPTPDLLWINRIEDTNLNITNENETHIKIFF